MPHVSARLLVISLLSIAMWGSSAGRITAQPSSPAEHEVKAVFLYNFIRFTEWPAGSFATPEAPYLVCVSGNDPFGPLLEQVFGDRSVGRRPIETLRVAAGDPRSPDCHVTFVGVSDDAAALTAAAHSHYGVLTVGEGRRFAEDGGIIGFHLQDRRVRFSVNVGRAQLAGLRISSQLLNLADIVEDTTTQRGAGDEAR